MPDEIGNPKTDRALKKFNEDNNKENNDDPKSRTKKNLFKTKPNIKHKQSICIESKQLDSLDLTIDSVARNGPTTPNILSPNNHNILKSPNNHVDMQQALRNLQTKNPLKYWKRQYRHLLSTDAILSRLLLTDDFKTKKPTRTSDTTVQQISLKHQNIELIQENIQLAYKVINKCACSVLNGLCFGAVGKNGQPICTCDSNSKVKRYVDKQRSPVSNPHLKFKLFHHRQSCDEPGDDEDAHDLSKLSSIGDDQNPDEGSGLEGFGDDEANSSADEDDVGEAAIEVDDADDLDGETDEDEQALKLLNTSYENSFFLNKNELEADIDTDIEVAPINSDLAVKTVATKAPAYSTSDDDDDDSPTETDESQSESLDIEKAKVNIDSNNNMKLDQKGNIISRKGNRFKNSSA
jgi:hypothetical protein